MKLINCPHCAKRVSVDSDSCPLCGKLVFESTAVVIDETDYDRHYSDFISSTFTPRGIYKFQIIISIILMFISGFVIFFEHYNKEAPLYSYYLFLCGFTTYGITRFLIWKDKKNGFGIN
jgi:hypothetical protein